MNKISMIPRLTINRFHVKDVTRQVEKYLQIELGSKNRRERDETASDEHEWILNMEQTQLWKDSTAFSLLQVLYDISVDLQTCVSEAICHHMSKKGFETHWTICIPELQCSGPEDWKRLVPRLLLSRIFSFSEETLWTMAGAIQDARPDGILRVRGKGQKAPCEMRWETSFCNDSSAWEEQWMLLNCALQFLAQRVVLVLTGLEAHDFQHFADCLNYLDPSLCFDGLNLITSGESAIRHKILVLGKGNDDKSRYTTTSKWLDRFKINATVEIDGVS